MAFKDKPTVVRPNMDKKQAEYTERLRHYNEWLMDDTRDVTSTYPGFPGDSKKEKTTVMVDKPEVAPINPKKGSKNSMKIQNVSMKVASTQVMKRPKASTKQANAITIVQNVGIDKKHDAIAKIMADLGMSKAGATTYFHNARHFIERQSPVNA
jgi:hypothetical protein